MRSLLPSAFAGRAVPSEAASSGPSRFGVPGSRHPRRRSSRPCGFPAMRPVICSCSWDAARTGHSWLPFFQPTYRTSISSSSRPGRVFVPRRRSWDSLHPSQCCSCLREKTSSEASNPPAVSPASAASSLARGVRQCGPPDAWPRLLGVGLAGKPYRELCRPRYSFCAEGRSSSPARTALGFFSSCRFSAAAPIARPRWSPQWSSRGARRRCEGESRRRPPSPAPGLHFWSLSAHGLAAWNPRRCLQSPPSGAARALQRLEGPSPIGSAGVSSRIRIPV